MGESWMKYVCAFFLLLSRIEAGSWGLGAPATRGSLERNLNNHWRNDSGRSMPRMCLAHGVVPRMADYGDEHEEAVASHGQYGHMHHHSSHTLGGHHAESARGSSRESGRHFSNGEARHALSHGEPRHAVPHGEPRHVAPNGDVGHHFSNGEPERDESNGEIQSVLAVTHSGHMHQHSHQTPRDSALSQGSPGLHFGKSNVSMPKREAPICWLCAGRHRAFKRSAPSDIEVEGYPVIDDYRLPEYVPQGEHINNNEKKTTGNHPHQHRHHHHYHHQQIALPQEGAPIASPDQSLEPGGNECGENNIGECAAQLEDGGENSLRKKSVKIYQYSEDSLTSPLVEQKRSADSNFTTAKPNDHAGVCSGANCDNVKRCFDNCNNNLESPNSDREECKRPLLGGGRIPPKHCDVKLGNCHKINKREAHVGRKESKKHNHPQHLPHHHHCHYEM